MNEFKESLVVSRKTSGEIIMTEQLKNLLIELMKGNISKKELMNLTGIGDKGTVELKIKELVASNPNLEPLYSEYEAGKRKNFEGYDFRAEAIEMLRKDYSQSKMAKKIGVSIRSFSTRIKKLQEANSTNILGALLKEHAQRKMKRYKLTAEDTICVNLELDKYEEEFPVSTARYEGRTSLDVRRENLQRVVNLIEGLMNDGMTLKELNDKKIISEANFRKYRAELESLTIILDGKGKGEE